MSKPREKLQVEQTKASLLHSFQAAATGAAAALGLKAKTGQSLLLLHFYYIKSTCNMIFL